MVRRRARRARTSVGIVGAGAFALDVHVPTLLARHDVRVDWVADVSQAALLRSRRRFGLRGVSLAGGAESIPDSDAVLLAAPVGVREPYHSELAGRGCAVYVEKPFAPTTSEALSIIEAYRPGQAVCGFQRRLYSGTAHLANLVKDGMLGALRRVRIREGALARATGMVSDFRDDVSQGGGGILIDLGSHGIDMALRISQARSAELVSASLVMDGGIDRDVNLRADLTGSQPGIELLVELSWLRDLGRRVIAEFEHGCAWVAPSPGEAVCVERRGADTSWTYGADRGSESIWNAVSSVWTSLLASHRDRVAGPLDPSTCLPTISLVEQAYRHVRQP